MKSKPKVVVMGLGYIGLPTSALIAGKGIQVVSVDVNPLVVETVNKGKTHIAEPDLSGLVKQVVDTGDLQAKTRPEEADVFIIAVPTPFKSNHDPDISFVLDAAKSIAPYLRKGNLVILESTSPVGATERVFEVLAEARPDLIADEEKSAEPIASGIQHLSSTGRRSLIYVAYCPERVLPGKVIYELENNDRVIGGLDPESTEKAHAFYSLFVKGHLHNANAITAEMCKLVENAYRDVNIAFANELSLICDRAGTNVWDLIEMANKHPRVNILKPGCGVGGHCISVDPWFLVSQFPEDTGLILQARKLNDYKPRWVIEKIKETIALWKKTYQEKGQPTVACMGLTFKPDIDDLRESPAWHITRELMKEQGNVIACEPNISENSLILKTQGSGLRLLDKEQAIQQADIVVFLVAHREFRDIREPGRLSNHTYLDFCGK